MAVSQSTLWWIMIQSLNWSLFLSGSVGLVCVRRSVLSALGREGAL